MSKALLDGGGYDSMKMVSNRQYEARAGIAVTSEELSEDADDCDEEEETWCNLDGMMKPDGWFSNLTIVIILLNTAVMAMEADYPATESSDNFPSKARLVAWTVIDNIFLTFFVCEIMLRLIRAHRLAGVCSFFTDPQDWTWNWFDFLIVFFGVLDQWVMKVIVIEEEGAHDQKMSKMLMILRTLRILRVLRAVRLFKALPSLFLLVQGLYGSFSSVIYVALLFFAFILVFSIIICQIIMEDPNQFEDPQQIMIWFGTVGATARTLFTFLTCDDWSTPVRMVNAKMPWMEIVWILYMFIGTFTLISLLTGLMADQMENAREAAAQLEDKHTEDNLQAICKQIRLALELNNNEAYVTIERFKHMLVHHREELRSLDTPIDFDVREADDLFRAIDTDATGAVPWEDFCKTLVKLCKEDVQTKDVLWAEASLLKADKQISEIVGGKDGQNVHTTHWGTRVNNLHDRAQTLQEKITMLEDDMVDLMELKNFKPHGWPQRLREQQQNKRKSAS
jgi:voltage-gated sodium channel